MFPKQVGVATSGDCEAAVHSNRTYTSSNKKSNKIDLKNAFNSLERDELLKAIL